MLEMNQERQVQMSIRRLENHCLQPLGKDCEKYVMMPDPGCIYGCSTV